MNELLISEESLAKLREKHEKKSPGAPLDLGLVVYTDGGSKHDQGGWGLHGYLYADEEATTGCGVNGYIATQLGYRVKGDSMPVKRWDLIKDNNTQESTDVYQVNVLSYVNGFGSLNIATNNVAELEGFNQALDIIKSAIDQGIIKRVHLVLDSKYVISAIVRRNIYISNGFKGSTGKPLANVDLIKNIYAKIIPMMTGMGIEWSISWTEGHTDDYGNIQADQLASTGLVAALNGVLFSQINVADAKGFWAGQSKNEIDQGNVGLGLCLEMNMYDDTQLDNQTRADGLIPVFIGTHSDPEKVGQPDPNSIKGVAILKSVPNTFTELKEYIRKVDRVGLGFETYGPFFGNVNDLIRTNLVDQVNKYKSNLFVTRNHAKQIETFDKKVLVTRISPHCTAPKAILEFKLLHRILDEFKDDKNPASIYVNDLTDVFYKTTLNKKGKEETELLIGNDSAITTPVKYKIPLSDGQWFEKELPLILTFGTTAPKRRTLSTVKNNHPKVYVLTQYEANLGFRHYFVIKLDTDEWAIYTNLHSNLRVF